MAVLGEIIGAIMAQSGAITCAIVDIETGESLARAGVAVAGAVEAAGLVNARMLRAKIRMVHDLSQETIEDVLITLDRHYHIIRLIHVPSGSSTMFIYLVLDRSLSNLAIARRKIAELEQALVADPEASERARSARMSILGLGSASKLYGTDEDIVLGDDDNELPPFMRNDVAMKILGIHEDAEG